MVVTGIQAILKPLSLFVKVYLHTRVCVYASVCALMCELWGLRSLSVSLQFEKKERKRKFRAAKSQPSRDSQHSKDHSLKYTKLIFKFYFVLALSNWQYCLGEPHKGQGELKCLLYVIQDRTCEIGGDKKLEEKAICLIV